MNILLNLIIQLNLYKSAYHPKKFTIDLIILLITFLDKLFIYFTKS